MTENETEGLALLKHYADDADGRVILTKMAESIQVANQFERRHWTPTVRKMNGWTVNLRTGQIYAITLRRDEVEVLVVPDDLNAEERGALNAAARREYSPEHPSGSSRYTLDWEKAVELWESIESAHHEALRAKRAVSGSKNPEANALIDFLGRELDVELPYPDQGAGSTGRTAFRALARSLEERGLHFPVETVANYLLALQTKRFAILTGISGTGKTQIAMAVADSFRATIHDQRAEEPDGSAVAEDAVKLKAWPYHFSYRQIVLPVGFATRIHPFLIPEPSSNGGTISTAYPGGRTTLKWWRDPNPAKNVTWLMFAGAHDFRDWYLESFQPGDQYYISFREGERSEEHQIEFWLAEAGTVERELDNSAVVPVRPDWVDNRGLLGFLNPLTNEYSTTPFLSCLLDAQAEVERAEKDDRNPHPFFVVLDEMNLARVEHYFSDFLSALESGKPIPLHENESIEQGQTESDVAVPRKLRVPNNVFFTGTVNVDETTYMFSPKVLDRAFTIEFDRVDLDGYTSGASSHQTSDLSLDSGDGGLRLSYEKPRRKHWLRFRELEGGRFHNTLRELHGVLEEEHRHFGYRVANEIARFVLLARDQSADKDGAAKAAFDLALLQKVLPKFHGTQQELEDLLRRLFNFAVYGRDRGRGRNVDVTLDGWKIGRDGHLTPKRRDEPTGEPVVGDDPNVEPDPPEFPRTGAKIWRMLRRLEQRGFTSFIE